MKTINLEQGTPEWLEFRSTKFTGSAAPAMQGLSPYISRRELLRMMHTGDEQAITSFQRKLFDDGHAVEEQARPLAENRLGAELFPVTGESETDPKFAMSFDGVTMDERTFWECKQWNKDKAAEVAAGRIPAEDLPQVLHGFLVNDAAASVLYTVSDGTNAYTEHVELHRADCEDEIESLRRAWEQFADDLATYVPQTDEPQSIGRKMDALPALHIEVTGEVTASNLAEYKTHALQVFHSINTDLQTDQDFADAEQTVKWCKEVETRLDGAKDHALSQTASLDELFRTIGDLKEECRRVRLDLDKRVKSRKAEVRDEIRREGEQALAAHIEKLEARIDPKKTGMVAGLIRHDADFAGVMKGKRTVTTLRDAVDAEVARAKIATSEIADRIQTNVQTFEPFGDEYGSLFADMRALLTKAPDDFEAVVKSRVADHKAAEEKRRDEERERIRAEERARVEREAEKPAAKEPAAPSRPAPERSADKAEEPDNWFRVEVSFSYNANPGARQEETEQAIRSWLKSVGISHIEQVRAFPHPKREVAQ